MSCIANIGRLDGNEKASWHNIQVSVPSLPMTGSPAFFKLLRMWLNDCDAHHAECRKWVLAPVSTTDNRPTRVISIKNAVIHLVDCADIQVGDDESLKYAALSYTWGDTRQVQQYMTTQDNIEQHKREIPWDRLPILFRDVIRVARNLEIDYLWADILCIIQGEDGDIDEEVARMEVVYSSAYVVIAASRCTGINDMLLEPHSRVQSKIVYLDKGLWVGESADDFQQDVIDGNLNQRGWVLQERALARRTIYFTNNQTYWECGAGIRCETLTRMTNRRAAFLGDANFPQVAQRDTKGGRIRLFQILYEQYSRLQFGDISDRPTAIAGLEQRLLTAFETTGGYGIFERYLGRSILWQRANDEPSLQKIAFKPHQSRVPSWSWMSCSGAIKFPELPYDGVNWTTSKELCLVGSLEGTSSGERRWLTKRDGNTQLKITPRRYREENLLSSQAMQHIVWDRSEPDAQDLRCVVVGSLKAASYHGQRQHWVLIVQQSRLAGVFNRVGAGYLLESAINLDETEIDAVLQ